MGVGSLSLFGCARGFMEVWWWGGAPVCLFVYAVWVESEGDTRGKLVEVALYVDLNLQYPTLFGGY